MARNLAFARRVFQSFVDAGGVEATLLRNMSVISAKYGTVRCHMKIEPAHLNRFQTLHGGTIAALVDVVGSLAISSRGYFSTGVSTDLNTTYIRNGGTTGDEIFIEGVCDSSGRTLAYTQVVFRNSADQIFARGSHTKFVAKSLAHPENEIEGMREGTKE